MIECGPVRQTEPIESRGGMKAVFMEIEVGQSRDFTGTTRELRNLRKRAHWYGTQWGRVYRTRTEDGRLIVSRVA